MTIFGFSHESLDRHRISEAECLEALADPAKVEVDEGESEDGNPRCLWVGKTNLDRLIDVGVEYMDGMDWIYHANSVRAKFRAYYQWLR